MNFYCFWLVSLKTEGIFDRWLIFPWLISKSESLWVALQVAYCDWTKNKYFLMPDTSFLLEKYCSIFPNVFTIPAALLELYLHTDHILSPNPHIYYLFDNKHGCSIFFISTLTLYLKEYAQEFTKWLTALSLFIHLP